MSVYEIYFSPTGGTKKAADFLMEVWPQKEEVDLARRDFNFEAVTLSKDDICCIAVPSYGGRVPAVALERLRMLQVQGTRAILLVVYGNRAYDDTLLELKDTAKECGFLVQAAAASVAEHSILRQYGAGRPDAADQEELRSFGRVICEKLSGTEAEDVSAKLLVPGNRPYREFNGVPFRPKGGRKCNGCGICAEKCPVGAIPKEAPRTVDTQTCISCMRCIAVCPNGARQIHPAVLSAAGIKMKKALSGRRENEFFSPDL